MCEYYGFRKYMERRHVKGYGQLLSSFSLIAISLEMCLFTPDAYANVRYLE